MFVQSGLTLTKSFLLTLIFFNQALDDPGALCLQKADEAPETMLRKDGENAREHGIGAEDRHRRCPYDDPDE